MKKTIQNKDGSTEVVEGTAEEIAAYEKAKAKERANESPKPKRKILNEETVRQIAKEEAAKVAPIVIHGHGVCTCPICCPFKPYFTLETCQHEYPSPWLGVVPPNCKKCGMPASMPTITWCSDRVDIGVGVEAPSVVIGGTTIPMVGTYLVQN
jgi:hypothetical protein